MKFLVAGVFGAALSVGHFLLVGLVEVQAYGRHWGLGYDLMNRGAFVMSPGFPFSQYVLSAVLSAVVVVLLLSIPKSVQMRQVARVSYLVPGVAMFIIGGLLHQAAVRDASSARFAPGIEGWLAAGSTVTAIHLMLVLLIALVIRDMTKSRLARKSRKAVAHIALT